MVSRRLFSSCCGAGAQPRSPRTAEAPGSGELRERFGGVPALLSRTGLPAPSPSFAARGFSAIRGWGSSCRPHRGDGAPRGRCGGPRQPPPPERRAGLCWGRSAPPGKDEPHPGVSPRPGLPPTPSRGAGMGEGLHEVTGARPGHAAHTLHFLRVSRKTKQDKTKPPNPSKQNPKSTPASERKIQTKTRLFF